MIQTTSPDPVAADMRRHTCARITATLEVEIGELIRATAQIVQYSVESDATDPNRHG